MDVYFRFDLSIATDHGVAFECRAGEVVDLDDELAQRLLARRPDIVRPLSELSSETLEKARRRRQQDLYYKKDLAALIAPPPSEDSIIEHADKQSRLAAAKRFLATHAEVKA
jgi:hypothetical protein